MPAPMGTFHPNGRFAAPRSYWRGITFDITGYNITNFDNVYFWHKVTDPNEQWLIELDNRFWLWTSNRWTLDNIVTRFELTFLPFGTPVAQPFTLQLTLPSISTRPYLLFQFAGINFADYHNIDFPSPPSGYWSPPSL